MIEESAVSSIVEQKTNANGKVSLQGIGCVDFEWKVVEGSAVVVWQSKKCVQTASLVARTRQV